MTAPGLRIVPLTLMGGQHAGTVHFDDVRIDDDAALMGADGFGIDAGGLRRQANTAMALLSLDLVGVAEAALQRTVDHTTMRHQFGRPIASFQAAQHLVADMHIAVSAARLAARSAVFWLARGETATRETAIARMHAVTAAKLATLDAHQLHGGMGYVVDTDLHRYSERARLLATLGGGADEAAAWLTKESQ
jgi:alkylation response protein AidB-like acyl-CoA dehydrogenase